MKKFHLFLLAFAAIVPAAEDGIAASITNLDSIPYDLHVKIGSVVQEIHIDPGRTWNSDAYGTYVRYNNNWMELNFDSNYAIRAGGKLSEQSQGVKMHTRGM
jgi:hypothetical protein